MAGITIVSTLEPPGLIKVAAAWYWAQWGRKNSHALAGTAGGMGGRTSRVGWEEIGTEMHKGHPVILMRRVL